MTPLFLSLFSFNEHVFKSWKSKTPAFAGISETLRMQIQSGKSYLEGQGTNKIGRALMKNLELGIMLKHESLMQRC
jgi:hypothetical protein